MALGSADRSVSLPDPVEPALELTVSFEPDHRIRLDWAVSYGDGPQALSYPLDAPPERLGPRDPRAEAAVLEALPLPYEAFPQLVALGGPVPPRPAAHATLDGVGAWVFVEQVLPRLIEHGVRVTRAGEVVDYRRSESAPAIAVSAVERRDSADWFDLHLTVSMDGETVPFDELFVALAAGRTT